MSALKQNGYEMGFGDKIKKRQAELKLSDAEVARRMGISAQRFGHYANGTREPDREMLLKICDVLDVDPNYLYGHDTYKTMLDDQILVLAINRAQQVAERQKPKLSTEEFAEFVKELCKHAQVEKQMDGHASLSYATAELLFKQKHA
jgi:transcriptional regulator with XRE-family HTH domain